MKEPKWNDTQGYVDAGPAVDKEGTGHDDAVKADFIATDAKEPDWDGKQGYVKGGPGDKK
jgi:hypothetical protein